MKPALSFQQQQVRTSISEFAGEILANYSMVLFITLTLKQGIKRDDGTWAQVNKDVARKQMTWLLSRLDRAVFGNAAKKYGKRIPRIVAYEGGDGTTNLHVHLLIAADDDRMLATQFEQQLLGLWRSSDWGHKETNSQLVYRLGGATDYVTKFGTDAIDWTNTCTEDSDRRVRPRRHKYSHKPRTGHTIP